MHSDISHLVTPLSNTTACSLTHPLLCAIRKIASTSLHKLVASTGLSQVASSQVASPSSRSGSSSSDVCGSTPAQTVKLESNSPHPSPWISVLSLACPQWAPCSLVPGMALNTGSGRFRERWINIVSIGGRCRSTFRCRFCPHREWTTRHREL